MSLGIGSVLTIIFIVLKVLGEVDWSWITVFLPLIISALIHIALVMFLLLVKHHEEKKIMDEIRRMQSDE